MHHPQDFMKAAALLGLLALPVTWGRVLQCSLTVRNASKARMHHDLDNTARHEAPSVLQHTLQQLVLASTRQVPTLAQGKHKALK